MFSNAVVRKCVLTSWMVLIWKLHDVSQPFFVIISHNFGINWNSIVTACRGRQGQCQHLASEEQNVLSWWGCCPGTEFIQNQSLFTRFLPSTTTIMTAIYMVLQTDWIQREREWAALVSSDPTNVCALTFVSLGGPLLLFLVVRWKSSPPHLHNICATGCRFQHIGQLLPRPDLSLRLKQWRKPEKLPNHESFLEYLKGLGGRGGNALTHFSGKKKCNWAGIIKWSVKVWESLCLTWIH